MTWLLDLDGVVWRGSKAIAGSAEAVARLQASGERVGYVTNNSAEVSVQIDKLAAMGISADPQDLVNGPDAVALLIEPGWTVLCVGIGGLRAPLEAAGATVVMVDDVEGNQPPEVDAVVVSIRPHGTMRDLSLAVRGVLQCGRLLAPSSDPLYPVADGFDIGGGGLVHGVAYSTGVEPVVAGKPFETMAQAVRSRFDDISYLVGDQTRSDGGLAEQLNVPFVLVRSGVTSPKGRPERSAVPVAHEFEDLATAVDDLL